MSVVEERQEGRRGRKAQPELIDCDVHNAPQSHEEIKRHLPLRWRPYYDRGSHLGNRGGIVMGARPHQHIFRRDSVPQEGFPGSDFALMREQLLDRFNVVKALLITLDTVNFPQHGEVGAALAAAVNEWNAADWLARDPRLFGTISIPIEDPVRAAAEIGRVADNERFVGVMVPMHTREAIGQPKYWPIFEAAAEHGLPIVMHITAIAGVFSSVGIPTYMVEHHTGYAQPYQAQMISLLHSGVFDRFPTLQIVLAEGGFSWLPSLMWRLDRTWASAREVEPNLTARPSDLIRAHFSFTTQPIDEPSEPQFLLQLLRHIEMDDRLMLASDYPHWDFDDPTRVLPESDIGRELRRKITYDNAAHRGT
jgi:predicted TIM-barrel fold metal-dependent hydrolase